MSRSLRKTLAFKQSFQATDSDSYTGVDNAAIVTRTRTPWVRIWARWHWLQSSADVGLAPGTGSQPRFAGPPEIGPRPAEHLAYLDACVRMARENGVKVILACQGAPFWATAATHQAYGPPAGVHDLSREKGQYQCFPDVVGPTSPWAAWIRFLAERYSAGNPARPGTVHMLEFVNEPNFELWPQQTPRDPHHAVTMTAGMFSSAQAIRRAVVERFGSAPLMAGPATADKLKQGVFPARYSTNYARFTRELSSRLRRGGFADAGFVWTHHNYDDILYDRGRGTASPHAGDRRLHAAHVRDILAHSGWRGWPSATPGEPAVWLTEGGADRNELLRAWPAGFRGIRPPAVGGYTTAQADEIQRQLLQRAWDRVHDDRVGGGRGIVGFTNWLSYSATDIDSGLADPHELGSRARPAYLTWTAFPSAS